MRNLILGFVYIFFFGKGGPCWVVELQPPMSDWGKTAMNIESLLRMNGKNTNPVHKVIILDYVIFLARRMYARCCRSK